MHRPTLGPPHPNAGSVCGSCGIIARGDTSVRREWIPATRHVLLLVAATVGSACHVRLFRVGRRRLPDLVHELVHRLEAGWPRWGTRRIAGQLARLRVKASGSRVQRIVRRGPTRPAKSELVAASRARVLLTKRPDHSCMIDSTRVGGVVRPLWIGPVIGGLSRRVLTVRGATPVCSQRDTRSYALRTRLPDASGSPAEALGDGREARTGGTERACNASRGDSRASARRWLPVPTTGSEPLSAQSDGSRFQTVQQMGMLPSSSMKRVRTRRLVVFSAPIY